MLIQERFLVWFTEHINRIAFAKKSSPIYEQPVVYYVIH